MLPRDVPRVRCRVGLVESAGGRTVAPIVSDAPPAGPTSYPARARRHRGSADPAQRRFGAVVVLLVGAAGDRERAAVCERDGAATGCHPAVAGHDQALEPGLTDHAA